MALGKLGKMVVRLARLNQIGLAWHIWRYEHEAGDTLVAIVDHFQRSMTGSMTRVSPLRMAGIE